MNSHYVSLRILYRRRIHVGNFFWQHTYWPLLLFHWNCKRQTRHLQIKRLVTSPTHVWELNDIFFKPLTCSVFTVGFWLSDLPWIQRRNRSELSFRQSEDRLNDLLYSEPNYPKGTWGMCLSLLKFKRDPKMSVKKVSPIFIFCIVFYLYLFILSRKFA